MDLSEIALRDLKYDRTKITISFIPAVASGKLTFKMNVVVNRNYAFKDAGNGFVVPCFRSKAEVSKTVFADVFAYEQVNEPGDYGTYQTVPNMMHAEALNAFRYVQGRFPAFIGYFDTLFTANLSYSGFVVPTMLNRILPFERISDQKLIDEIKDFDFTEYGYEGMDDDNGGGDDDL